MMIEPYLNFNGHAAEAIEFYEKLFNGTNKRVMRWGDVPAGLDTPADEAKRNWILHGEIELCGTNFSISDCEETFPVSNLVSLMARLETPDEVRRVYDGLRAEGGQVLIEIGPTFYSALYAWVRDKYGVSWQLMCGK